MEWNGGNLNLVSNFETDINKFTQTTFTAHNGPIYKRMKFYYESYELFLKNGINDVYVIYCNDKQISDAYIKVLLMLNFAWDLNMYDVCIEHSSCEL